MGDYSYFLSELHRELEDIELPQYTDGSSAYFNSVVLCMRTIISKASLCAYGGSLYFFNGRYYELLDKYSFQYILEEFMGSIGIRAGYWEKVVRTCLSVAYRNRVVKQSPRNLLCFQNGVVDLSEKASHPFFLRSFSPDYDVFYQLPYNYDSTAKCPLWVRFLEEVLPDKDVRAVLQEFLGLIFIDRAEAKIEKMLFLLGEGANGKGVVFETIKGLLGKENCSYYDLDKLIGTEGLRNRAEINGKLVNYCSDMGYKYLMDEGIKRLISGEAVDARKLYGDPFFVYNPPLMIGNTNRMPTDIKDTRAFKRRIQIIPFDVYIDEDRQDKYLAKKLMGEYSGILNWILEGRERLLSNNFIFSYSSDIEKCTTDYFESGDTVERWLTSKGYVPTPLCVIDVAEKIPTRALFDDYIDWCKKGKIRREYRVESINAFSRVMTIKEFKKTRRGEIFIYNL